MSELLTAQELSDLAEIQRLLDAAYDHYVASADGCWKSSEGWFSVEFGNYFERNAGERIRRVEIYSYAFGSGRHHYFDNTAAAVRAVRTMHAQELASEHSGDWSGLSE